MLQKPPEMWCCRGFVCLHGSVLGLEAAELQTSEEGSMLAGDAQAGRSCCCAQGAGKGVCIIFPLINMNTTSLQKCAGLMKY